MHVKHANLRVCTGYQSQKRKTILQIAFKQSLAYAACFLLQEHNMRHSSNNVRNAPEAAAVSVNQSRSLVADTPPESTEMRMTANPLATRQQEQQTQAAQQQALHQLGLQNLVQPDERLMAQPPPLLSAGDEADVRPPMQHEAMAPEPQMHLQPQQQQMQAQRQQEQGAPEPLDEQMDDLDDHEDDDAAAAAGPEALAHDQALLVTWSAEVNGCQEGLDHLRVQVVNVLAGRHGQGNWQVCQHCPGATALSADVCRKASCRVSSHWQLRLGWHVVKGGSSVNLSQAMIHLSSQRQRRMMWMLHIGQEYGTNGR